MVHTSVPQGYRSGNSSSVCEIIHKLWGNIIGVIHLLRICKKSVIPFWRFLCYDGSRCLIIARAVYVRCVDMPWVFDARCGNLPLCCTVLYSGRTKENRWHLRLNSIKPEACSRKFRMICSSFSKQLTHAQSQTFLLVIACSLLKWPCEMVLTM